MNTRMLAGLLLALLLTAPVAFAEDWVHIGKFSDYLAFYYDRDSLSRNGKEVDYVIKIEVSGGGLPVPDNESKKYTRIISARRIDCEDKLRALLSNDYFDQSGEFVYHHEYQHEYEPIIWVDIYKSEYQVVCAP